MSISISPNRFRTVALALVLIYGLAPFVAGLLGAYDRRGPKVFAEGHHEVLYTMGYYLAGRHHHDGKPRVPYMQERSWFYGLQGERMPEQQIREKLESLKPRG
jgi:hypothetical protein